MSLCDQQHLISGFQCHLDRANPSGDQPRAALHDSARQVHHHLLPGGTCKRHAVSHALADRPRRVLCRTAGFGAGNKDSFLPVYIVSRQLNWNDVPGILDAADQDIQTLSLNDRRTRYQTVLRNGNTSCLQRLQQPQSYPASLFNGLVLRDAGGDGICPHLVAAPDSSIEAVIPLDNKRSYKSGIRNRL